LSRYLNAGPFKLLTFYPLEETEEPTEPDLKILNVNLIGVMYTAKLAMHYFNQQRNDIERDRCLILKSSLAGYIDIAGAPLYQTAKFGVRGLMHCLRRLDYMRVCVIAPW
jgi:NAD(P)-dependent dehydrogenase (short-subunit alcohol dehydrogenase family)